MDTDIVVLVGALLSEDSERRVLDEGRGNKIFIMLLSQIKMSRSRRDAPIDLHSFTGCVVILHYSENLEKGVGCIWSQREISKYPGAAIQKCSFEKVL